MSWRTLTDTKILAIFRDLSGDDSGDDESESYNVDNEEYASLGRQGNNSKDSVSSYEPSRPIAKVRATEAGSHSSQPSKQFHVAMVKSGEQIKY